MPQAPDLFVVCRHCGSEVSSFVTECPYCGTRLRKRAPKLEGTPLGERGRGRRRGRGRARLPKLRPGEIPGIRAETAGRPVAAVSLVVLIALGAISLAVVSPVDVGIVGKPQGDWWKVATAPFFAESLWYAAACGAVVALFGGLLELRHGHLVAILLFALCGIGGVAAAAALETVPLAFGANGAALGMLAAWSVRPALELRREGESSADLLGVAVIAAALLLMPLVVDEASPTAGAVGLLAGLVAGVALARR